MTLCFADSVTRAKTSCTSQSFCPVAAAAWHSDASRGKADCASCVIREKWRNDSAFSPFIITGKRKQFCQASGKKKKKKVMQRCNVLLSPLTLFKKKKHKDKENMKRSEDGRMSLGQRLRRMW